MIRTEAEYEEAVGRVDAEKARIAEYRARLEETKLEPDEIERALDPLLSFHLQLEDEVRSYERLRRGEFDEIVNLQGLGQVLVGLRVAVGLSQRELAQRLDVHESQVSRDERNEYHGISIERTSRILEALGVELRSRLVLPIPRVLPEKASP